MTAHRATKHILKREFSVCWGGKQNLHSCHMEEYEIMIDTMTAFVKENKRQISTKAFHSFIKDLEAAYQKLKESTGGVDNI